jgi:prevent-host-death family protein
MKISTKELRTQPGKFIDRAAKGCEITVTFRGKALAKIIPILNKTKNIVKEDSSIFGLWKDHANSQTVDELINDLRKGRRF